MRDLRVADNVAELLGAEYVTRLRRGPAPARARCVICGVEEDLATTAMTVLVAPGVDNARVVFAHPRCAPSGLLPAGPGPLADQLRTRTAIHGLALTVDGGPPVWAIETDIAVHGQGGGELVDELLATLLGLGFGLVPTLDGPMLAGLPALAGIRLVAQADAAGATGTDVGDHAADAARAEGIVGWQLEALESLLVIEPVRIELGDDPSDRWYDNGRHRVTAMLETGVRRTIVVRLGLLDPVTGQRLQD